MDKKIEINSIYDIGKTLEDLHMSALFDFDIRKAENTAKNSVEEYEFLELLAVIQQAEYKAKKLTQMLNKMPK